MSDKDTIFSKKKTINFRGNIRELDEVLIMGILNVTPDSFYDGGKHSTHEAIEKQVDKMIMEGAAIIDVGTYSSRPGAAHISVDEEWVRLEFALNIIRKKYPDILISVDTFRSQLAERALRDFNIQMINDISAGLMDPELPEIVSRYSAPYVIMHMQGTPQTMQNNPHYDHLINDIMNFFNDRITYLKSLDIYDIIVDPGFGFGKTLDQNYQLLHHLNDFSLLEMPLLAGLSRKSMIYKFLNTVADEALTGTIVLNTLAAMNGADILRVHDVKEAKEAILLTHKYKNSKINEWYE